MTKPVAGLAYIHKRFSLVIVRIGDHFVRPLRGTVSTYTNATVAAMTSASKDSKAGFANVTRRMFGEGEHTRWSPCLSQTHSTLFGRQTESSKRLGGASYVIPVQSLLVCL